LTSLDTVPGVRILQGSYYEVGLQLGASMTSLQLPEPADEALNFALECEALLAQIYPPLLQKVEGMIEGSALSRRAFEASFYASHFSPSMGCTNLVVLPPLMAADALIVGVNYDWYYYSRQWREIRETRSQSALPSLEVTHHWAGSPDGVNEAGLGVFLSVLPEEKIIGPGLAWHLVTDILLDTCHDVAEACRFVTSVPHLGAFNYLITDASGRAVVAEALPGGVTLREPEDGFIVATNHLPGREAPEQELSENESRRQRRSLERYARATETLGNLERPATEADIKDLLCDHETPICRGNHDPVEGDDSFDNVFGTIWSLISRPVDRTLQVAWGHPCRSAYHMYALGQREVA
jgi:predicted choloylglycine hydrolase